MMKAPLRTVDRTDTPSIPYQRLSETDKLRFAAGRPNEALVLQTLCKTGKDIDAGFIDLLKTLNTIVLDVLPCDDAETVIGASRNVQLTTTRLAEDTWRIDNAPLIFEVCFEGVAVTVDITCATASKSRRSSDVGVTATDDASFASTATPSDVTVTVPRLYGENGKGRRQFVVLEIASTFACIQFVEHGSPKTFRMPPTTRFPDAVTAHLVCETRTASFARFTIPSIEVYLDLTRDALNYVTKTFCICQTMCGFKATGILEFLSAATTEQGVITPEYAGSDFHSVCKGVVETFSACRDVTRMDAVRKHFKPRPGTSFVNATLMAMVRMHVVGGGCADATCPARPAALAASLLRQQLGAFAPGTIRPSSASTLDTEPTNSGMSHLIGVLVRSFKQYMLLPSSVHVNADALFSSTSNTFMKACFTTYMSEVRAARETAPPISLAALPSVPCNGASYNAAWNALDVITRTTRTVSPCSVFSERLSEGHDAALGHLYDAATSCMAADFAKESLLCRLTSVPGMARSRHVVAVAKAVEDLAKRHVDLQRVVVSMYDTLGTSAASLNVPETSQLVGLCCAVASVGATLTKLAGVLESLLKAVRDTAFGALKRELLAFAYVADRMHATKKRTEICKRMTAMGGRTPCASMGPCSHSSHEWELHNTDRRRIICTHPGCTDVHATQRMLDDTACFSCSGRSFGLPTADMWVYSCSCCFTFFGTSADFEVRTDDGTDGDFIAAEVPVEFDARQRPSKTRRVLFRVLPSVLGSEDGEGDARRVMIDMVTSQHASTCTRAGSRDTTYRMRPSTFITCSTCSLPVFIASAVPATCFNPSCPAPYGRPGVEQYAINTVSGDSTCMACGVVHSEHALSSEPFKVNHDSDVESGTNNVQNGAPLDRRASIQLSTSLSTPFGGTTSGMSKTSFSTLLETHRLAERVAILRGPADARTTPYLRDTQKRAFFEVVNRYLDRHVLTVAAAEWAKDVFTVIRETDQLLRPGFVHAAVLMMAALKSAETAKQWKAIADVVQWVCSDCGTAVTAATTMSHKTTCASQVAIDSRALKRASEKDASIRARKRAKALLLPVLDM